MSTTYKIIQGDNYEKISRKIYGDERYSNIISSANPDTQEPLQVGVEIIAPTISSLPKNIEQLTPFDSIDEVVVLINNRRFRYFESISITRSIDSIDTVSFSAPFEPDLTDFKNTFRPLSFLDTNVSIGGELVFTGTMVNVTPTSNDNKKMVSVGCYSKPGVLSDCCAPAGLYPIEFNNQGLSSIALTLLSPFGLTAVFNGSEGAVFERAACTPSQKIYEFLVDLARERNLVVGNTAKGELFFTKTTTNFQPVAKLSETSSPLLSVLSNFNPQEYYSHITGIEPTDLINDGAQYTVKNSRLNLVRPFVFQTNDSYDGEVKQTVDAKAGRMFANAASYTVKVSTWRDSNGKLWEPNTVVNLLAPNSMIYNEYSFIIREIQFDADSKSKTATLSLIIPGSFSGIIPDRLPWD